MNRLLGALKVLLVLALDFLGIYSTFHNTSIAIIAIGIIVLYVIFGGYLAILKDRAVISGNLPSYQRDRLEKAKAQILSDIKSTAGVNLSGINLYLVPGNDELNATAYGANCISVTDATLKSTDPVTLRAVLAHEACHIINFDAEFNRAAFCSVTLFVVLLSIMSFSAVAIIFLLFLVLSWFKSWLGFMAFRGTTRVVRSIFEAIKKGVVIVYRTLLGLVSRNAEYRSDRYACILGYGVQLAHFLELAEPDNQRFFTITDAIYQSHPPTPKRIARIESQLLLQNSQK